MSNKSDLAKQEALRREQAALAAESARDRQSAREEGEVSKQMTAQTTDYFNFLKDPTRDFSNFRPITAGLVDEGREGAEAERTARGSMQFGAAGADPNLQAVLKSNESERKAIRRGRALQESVNRYDSLMRAQAGDLASQDTQRRMGSAGLTTNASANATNSWASFSPRPHWGLSLSNSLIAGASTAARMSGGL